MKRLRSIAERFEIRGTVGEVAPLGHGHIHATYRVRNGEPGAPDYVLQRINHAIFRDVALLQRNIQRVTDHIRAKYEAAGDPDAERKALRLVPARDGTLYWTDGGEYWRMSVFVPGARTYERIAHPRQAYDTGAAFGRFHEMLSDLPEGALGETIPRFHDMGFRFENLRRSVAADPKGRLTAVRDLVGELESRAQEMCRAEELYRQGLLPKRVSHCDTKINNVLFDEHDRPLCVIDLDTTMPGFVLSDFGDFIRTAGNTGEEDDSDLGRIDVDMDIFRAFAEGYLGAAAGFLTPTERELLPFGARMLTCMQTVRFLTDYLDGDTYYKIHHPEHNLQRSRAQFRLLQRIEEKEAEMNAFIRSFPGGGSGKL